MLGTGQRRESARTGYQRTKEGQAIQEQQRLQQQQSFSPGSGTEYQEAGGHHSGLKKKQRTGSIFNENISTNNSIQMQGEDRNNKSMGEVGE